MLKQNLDFSICWSIRELLREARQDNIYPSISLQAGETGLVVTC